MEVVITGRNVDVPEAVRVAVTEKLNRLTRFLDGKGTAEVHFSEEKNPRIADREVCEITLKVRRRAIRAKAASPDAFTAIDKVVDKLEHQVERLKGRRIGRSHPRRQPSVDSVPVLDEPDEEGEGEQSRIVERKRIPVKPMTPEEAALQMDLLGHAFFFFINADTEQAAVLYRRPDGALGLMDAT